MKSSDPLLLADGTLRCGMYPAVKAAISQRLVTPGSLAIVTLLLFITDLQVPFDAIFDACTIFYIIFPKKLEKVVKLYTANVLSAEITDECLQTKSKDN